MSKDKQSAKSNQYTYYFTFDLDKTLPLPKLSTSVCFYMRQLWLYNLGIHLIAGNRKEVHFQHWTEGESGRGVTEIGSGILLFLKNAQITEGTVYAWSDSCSGQNKNFFIVCLWQYLIKSMDFVEINHKFPVPGHSFMDSDRDFAQVEKKVRRVENIYSVDEYINILEASQKPKPKVSSLAPHLFEIKDLPEICGLINRQKNTEGEKVQFRDKVRWIKITKFGEYEYKTTFSDTEPWKKVNIMRDSESPEHETSLELPAITSPNNHIKKAKHQDIQKQLKYIPSVHHDMYKKLTWS